MMSLSDSTNETATQPLLSIVVPMLNERQELPTLLSHLRHWQSRGCEVLLVDGGSSDGSLQKAQAEGWPVIRSKPGRSLQMNRGVAYSQGSALLFLHADTRLPDNADEEVLQALQEGCGWGRFDVQISGGPALLRLVAWCMNQRSRLGGIATGDQALFMTRELFDEVGGFPQLPLMEDIELCRRLRQRRQPRCLRSRVMTSGRRWQQGGVCNTIWLMWRLRWRYWRGVPAAALAREYQ